MATIDTTTIATTTTTKTVAERKAEIYEQISGLLVQYNEAMQLGEYRTMARLDEEIKSLVKDYTAECETECFDALLQTENPLLEAARVLEYATIRVREETDSDTGDKSAVIVPNTITIDPLRLNKRVKEGLGADKDWHKKIKYLNFAMVTRKAAKLGIPAKECCDGVKQVFRDLEAFKCMCEGTDPTGDEALLEDIQLVITGMLGEGYNAQLRDVEYIWTLFAKRGKRALQTICSNNQTVRKAILEVCHRIVTEAEYTIDTKAKK